MANVLILRVLKELTFSLTLNKILPQKAEDLSSVFFLPPQDPK